MVSARVPSKSNANGSDGEVVVTGAFGPPRRSEPDDDDPGAQHSDDAYGHQ